MIEIMDGQENYFMITDGADFTVLERRAGKFYGLHKGARHGVALDDTGMVGLIHEGRSHTEREARDLLGEVATQWRELFEHVR